MVKKLWGGRFQNATNADAENFTSSIDVDKDLYNFDILGSIAHVEMLSQQKIISKSEKSKVIKGLKKIKNEIELG